MSCTTAGTEGSGAWWRSHRLDREGGSCTLSSGSFSPCSSFGGRRFLLGRAVLAVLSPRFRRVWKGSCSCDQREKWHGVTGAAWASSPACTQPFLGEGIGAGLRKAFGALPPGKLGAHTELGVWEEPRGPCSAAPRSGLLVQEVLGGKRNLRALLGPADSRIWDAGGGETRQIWQGDNRDKAGVGNSRAGLLCSSLCSSSGRLWTI